MHVIFLPVASMLGTQVGRGAVAGCCVTFWPDGRVYLHQQRAISVKTFSLLLSSLSTVCGFVNPSSHESDSVDTTGAV
ncbi:hypothetical protein F5Y01DRAFT_283624 [Xylaria sp. FL0043]|nr:hypothetical protein F5Y01DRAFT_283624 [Xylaria sp. FL0043]